MIETINRVLRVRKKLVQRLGRELTEREIAEEVGVDVTEVRSVRKMAQKPISLQSRLGDDGDATVGDLIPDAGSVNPFEATEGLDVLTADIKIRGKDVQVKVRVVSMNSEERRTGTE